MDLGAPTFFEVKIYTSPEADEDYDDAEEADTARFKQFFWAQNLKVELQVTSYKMSDYTDTLKIF